MAKTAILVVGTESLLSSPGAEFAFVPEPGRLETPIACLDVLGASILERTIERLQNAGVNRIWIVAQDYLARFVPGSSRKRLVRANRPLDEELAVGRISCEEAARGAQTIVLIKLGAYMEFDLAEVLEFHNASGAGSTIVCDNEGPLDFWIFNASGLAQSGITLAAIFESETSASYILNDYVNRLTGPGQLRRLIRDAFTGHCGLRPRGREIEPGIWVADGARIHRDARLVAPVYVGKKTRLHASALITQFSNVEARCVVGCGSIVEDTSILPCTHIGKGLDVSDAVVEGSRLVNLRRMVAVEIHDPKLIRKIEPWQLLRFSRKTARPAFAGEAAKIGAVPPLSPTHVSAYLDSSKEQYEQWETCNREAAT